MPAGEAEADDCKLLSSDDARELPMLPMTDMGCVPSSAPSYRMVRELLKPLSIFFFGPPADSFLKSASQEAGCKGITEIFF